MQTETKAKPLSAVMGVLIHGQTLKQSLNQLFNRGVYPPEEAAAFDLQYIKQQAINDVGEITIALESIKKELEQL